KAAQPLSTGNAANSALAPKQWLLEKATAGLSNRDFLELFSSLFHARFNPEHSFEKDDDGRVHLPLLRPALTYKQVIRDAYGTEHHHYVTWGLGPDGKPLEQYTVAGEVGSAYRGMLDTFA